jgi:hypothetical protein
MLLTAAPAVAVQQPPNYDDLCQYLDPQIWPDCYAGEASVIRARVNSAKSSASAGAPSNSEETRSGVT